MRRTTAAAAKPSASRNRTQRKVLTPLGLKTLSTKVRAKAEAPSPESKAHASDWNRRAASAATSVNTADIHITVPLVLNGEWTPNTRARRSSSSTNSASPERESTAW